MNIIEFTMAKVDFVNGECVVTEGEPLYADDSDISSFHAAPDHADCTSLNMKNGDRFLIFDNVGEVYDYVTEA